MTASIAGTTIQQTVRRAVAVFFASGKDISQHVLQLEVPFQVETSRIKRSLTGLETIITDCLMRLAGDTPTDGKHLSEFKIVEVVPNAKLRGAVAEAVVRAVREFILAVSFGIDSPPRFTRQLVVGNDPTQQQLLFNTTNLFEVVAGAPSCDIKLVLDMPTGDRLLEQNELDAALEFITAAEDWWRMEGARHRERVGKLQGQQPEALRVAQYTGSDYWPLAGAHPFAGSSLRLSAKGNKLPTVAELTAALELIKQSLGYTIKKKVAVS